jgi:guanylate kinase
MYKMLLFAAPSGAGKTTIVRHLLKVYDHLAFSVSATTRQPRPGEVDGVDYYFLSPEDFQAHIDTGAFVEWEEVYPGKRYGTLHSELQRLWKAGKTIVFHIDVQGAMNLKKAYPSESLAIFVKPPSLKALENRLNRRDTESEVELAKRIAKAGEEMEYETRFDVVLVNDQLKEALKAAENLVESFTSQTH